MLPNGPHRAALIAVAVLMISGCSSSLDAIWAHTVTTRFSGRHELALNSYFNSHTQTIAITAYADVPGGVAGEVEITGPRHLRCPGSFNSHPPVDFFTFFASDQETHWRTIANLPQFSTAGGDPGDVTGPQGRYTVTVRVPPAQAHVATTIEAPAMYAGPLSLYTKPPACYPIADTPAQRRTLLDTYLAALVMLTGQTPPSLQPELLGPITDARNAIATANAASDPAEVTRAYGGAARALRQLQDRASAHPGALVPTVASRIGEATNDAIHLLQ